MFKGVSTIVDDTIFLAVRNFAHPLHLKLEALNPAGSIKLKTARALVDSAFSRGLVTDQTVFIESSSGNLGVALAMICAERGLKFTCVIDPNCSEHNEKTIRTLGATIVKVTNRDENGGFLGARIDYIRRKLAEDPHHLWLNQYENPANPEVHARLTASAISSRFQRLDYLFVGAGTTGTLMGCLDHFSCRSPRTRIIAVDSVGSITFGQSPAPRHIPGLGTSSMPPIFDPRGLYAAEMIPEAQTVLMCRYLARNQGIFAGGSTGTVLAGVHAWRDRIPPDAVVVAISPDWGDRYLGTVYDDDWVRRRFGEEVLSGDLARMSEFPSFTLMHPGGRGTSRSTARSGPPFAQALKSAV